MKDSRVLKETAKWPPTVRSHRGRITLALSLIVAGVGILIHFLVGCPAFRRSRPGPIIPGTAGILVFVLSGQRWPLIVGVFAALFVTVGGLIEGSVWGRLGDPASSTWGAGSSCSGSVW